MRSYIYMSSRQLWPNFIFLLCRKRRWPSRRTSRPSTTAHCSATADRRCRISALSTTSRSSSLTAKHEVIWAVTLFIGYGNLTNAIIFIALFLTICAAIETGKCISSWPNFHVLLWFDCFMSSWVLFTVYWMTTAYKRQLLSGRKPNRPGNTQNLCGLFRNFWQFKRYCWSARLFLRCCGSTITRHVCVSPDIYHFHFNKDTFQTTSNIFKPSRILSTPNRTLSKSNRTHLEVLRIKKCLGFGKCPIWNGKCPMWFGKCPYQSGNGI